MDTNNLKFVTKLFHIKYIRFKKLKKLHLIKFSKLDILLGIFHRVVYTQLFNTSVYYVCSKNHENAHFFHY